MIPKIKHFKNLLFKLLQEDEAKAKRALITLCDLHRMKVWFEDSTANALCMACFHPPRIMIAAFSFLLDFEKTECGDDGDNFGEDEPTTPQPYVATHKGTLAIKKKRKGKMSVA